MFFKLGVVILTFNSYLHIVLSAVSSEVSVNHSTDPKFSAPIANVTAAVGREAILTCQVIDLGTYKVAWLRVDTQTILTIQNNVITKNHRVGISFTEKRTWQLRLKDIRESDKGWYMCQINTDPMKSQVGYLDVVVPPDILDYPTSTDMVVREGSNVTLKCAATGSPQPNITWRREGGERIMLHGGSEGSSSSTQSLPFRLKSRQKAESSNAMSARERRLFNNIDMPERAIIDGPTLNIPRVNRLHMGSYLCIASNGVPPTVSKRITLIVHFPPMISVANQLVGAYEGQQIKLECHSEAYPKSINYWTKEKGDIVPQGGKFEPILIDNAYKVVMRLTIKPVSQSDFGSYRCVAKNSLGDTDGTIKLYKIPRGEMNNLDFHESRRKGKHKKGNNFYDPSNDVSDGETSGSSSKRKELMIGEPNDSYDYSSSINEASSCLAIIISIASLITARLLN